MSNQENVHAQDHAPLLTLRGIAKRYPNGVLANDAVDLDVMLGEIHALLGENGAGKSTLLKLLYGLEQPSAGTMHYQGDPLALRSPRDAIAAGIGLVPQHVQLVPSLTVAQNVVLGIEPSRCGFLDAGAAREATRRLAERYGLAVAPDARAGTLSLGEQQRVELLKALYRDARLLLLDEPSAVLAPAEAASLYAALRGLARQGLTVILITHKLAEVLQVADRYTVLRGGRVTGSGTSATAGAALLTRLIAGATPPAAPTRTSRAGPARLVVRGLQARSGTRAIHAIDLDIGAGEILGIAGVEGNGQDVLADTLAGLIVPDGGTVLLDGVACCGLGVRGARACGVAALAEDRLHDGVAPGLSIAENLLTEHHARAPLSRRLLLRRHAIADWAAGLLREFGVRATGPDQPIGALSGGNMQKLVLARALAHAPRLLVASQPTRGVDIGAAAALHERLRALRDAGAAILLVSADLDELLLLSDRIAVLADGHLVGHFPAGDATPQGLAACMTGGGANGDTAAVLPASQAVPA